MLSGFIANEALSAGMIHSRTMRQIGIALLTALLVLAHPPVRVSAQTAAFRGAIRNSRSDIDARNGHLLGPGAVKIRDAVSHACYIFVGEDNGIAEVPEFAEALTSELVGDEIHTLALEVSPSVAGQLSVQLASANPRQTFATFLRQNQLTVPFYNTVEEFEFLQRVKSRIGTSFRLIGFDQDFLGSAHFLLQKIGEQALSDDLRVALDEFKKQEQEANTRASRSGRPEDLFLLSVDTARLQSFADALSLAASTPHQSMIFSQVAEFTTCSPRTTTGRMSCVISL